MAARLRREAADAEAMSPMLRPISERQFLLKLAKAMIALARQGTRRALLRRSGEWRILPCLAGCRAPSAPNEMLCPCVKAEPRRYPAAGYVNAGLAAWRHFSMSAWPRSENKARNGGRKFREMCRRRAA